MSDTTQQAALRAEFEAWLGTQGVVASKGRDGISYWPSTTQAAWLAYLAGAARSAAPDPAPVAWIDRKELAATQEVMNGYCSGIVWNKKVGPSYLPLYLATPADKGLTVWYGSMPESNGKKNWTAVLCRKEGNVFDQLTDGFTLARSEYPDRVRYDADRVRYLLGELTERPDILEYGGDLREPATPADKGDVESLNLLRQALEVLENLHAEVWGECPSLLNEDSGGNFKLDLDCLDAIAALRQRLEGKE